MQGLGTSTPAARRASRTRVRVLAAFCGGLLLASGAGAAEPAPVDPAQRYKDLGLFSRVLTLVRSHYVEPVDESELLRSAVRGLLLELDPHSAFMEADAFDEMQVDTKGEFHGIGIEITKRQGKPIEVVAPIDGTPAARAGLRARDWIVGICPTEPPDDWETPCRGTERMSLFEAVRLMRGKRGTSIVIEVMREGFDQPRSFEIVRDVVKVASVEGKLLEPGYAYVRIRSFQERTGNDVQELVQKLAAEAPGGLRGMVLDMRDNPGGLLDQAVIVADAWMADGLVVYTQGRDGAERQDYRADADDFDGHYPLVVLVNEGTASASEIVAGALQDHHRALILGARTFGKGSVQTVYPLEDGSGLRLTTALYYTPSGRSIQEVGIVPDIEVAAASPVAKRSKSFRVRERDLEGHFRHESSETEAGERDTAADDPSASGPDAAADEKGEAEEGDASDAQLDRALEVLKSWDYFERLREPAPEAKTVALETAAPAVEHP
ncbi:MAG: S41 family peptidase [Myxococcota bacterium]